MRNQNRNVYSTGGSRSMARNAAAACALMFFALFLALKVNGYLDFSASYEIKDLAASRETLNLQLLLDHEPGTVWGTMQNASGGDWLEVTFRRSRQVNAVELEADAGYRMDPANGAWVLCGSSRDGNRILPDSAFAAEKILLKAAEGQTDVPWIVKELRVV